MDYLNSRGPNCLAYILLSIFLLFMRPTTSLEASHPKVQDSISESKSVSPDPDHSSAELIHHSGKVNKETAYGCSYMCLNCSSEFNCYICDRGYVLERGYCYAVSQYPTQGGTHPQQESSGGSWFSVLVILCCIGGCVWCCCANTNMFGPQVVEEVEVVHHPHGHYHQHDGQEMHPVPQNQGHHHHGGYNPHQPPYQPPQQGFYQHPPGPQPAYYGNGPQNPYPGNNQPPQNSQFPGQGNK